MNNNKYTLNIDFSMLRRVEDGTSVNTTITSKYMILTIPPKDSIIAIREIEKDFNELIDKYFGKYQLQIINEVK